MILYTAVMCVWKTDILFLTFPILYIGRFVEQLEQPLQINITPIDNKIPELFPNITETVTYTEKLDEALFPNLEITDQDVFCVQPTTLSLANVTLMTAEDDDILVVSLPCVYFS